MKKKLTYWLVTGCWLLVVSCWQVAFAQGSLAPVLVGSTGNYSTAGFGSISSSVGEPVVTTTPLVGGIQLTQGFQQSLLQISISSMGSSPNDSICLGKSATLSASITNNNIPTTTYSWSPAASLSCSTCPNPIAAPTITTTYTLVVSDGINGSDSDTIKIYVLPNPTATITLSTNDSICAGSPTTLTGNASGTTGPYSFVWSPGGTTTPAITVSPPVGNNTFTVVVTDKFGCKGSATQTVTVISTPTITITGTTTVCSGNSTTLSASGANSYLWSPGGATTFSITTGALTSNTTYTVTGNNFMCADTKTVSVTVNPLPSANIVPAITTICSGQSTTFAASAGGTGPFSYSWNTGSTNDSIFVSPTINTTYSVAVTDGNGCIRNVSAFVTVNPTPTVSISPASSTICSGSNATLTASGGVSYLWNTGETTTIINPSPTTASAYTVTGTDANSCSTTATASVSVNTPPFVIITKTQTIFCEGDSSRLTASGGTTYLWNPGGQTTTAIWAMPSITTTFTLTVSSGVCSVDSFITLTVLPNPTITVSPNTSICNGQNVTLTASGGNTYSWSTTETTTSIVVSPTTNTTYTVIGYDLNFCANTTTVSVVVNSPPTAFISGSTTICSGTNATLTASGGVTYLWSTSATTAAITDTPTGTTTYTVTVTNAAGCTDTATATVNVIATPAAPVATTNAPICAGNNLSLNASSTGATYSWTGPNSFSSAMQNPIIMAAGTAASGTYSVIATANGCPSIAGTVTVTVNPLPNIVSSGSTSICPGDNATLTASGGNTYSWSTTETTNPIIVSPTTNTTYTVIGYDANFCTNTATVAVTFNTPPTASISGASSICAGETATLTASGGTSYSWSTGATASFITVSPTAASSYTAFVTDANGCSDTATHVLNISPSPTISITYNSGQVVCQEDSITMTASGGSLYYWPNLLDSNASVTFLSPVSGVKNYSVIVGTAAGCLDTAIATLTISPTPSIVITGDSAICTGETTTLLASGGTIYSWSTTETTSSISVAPTIATGYTVFVTDGNGCNADSGITVSVNSPPIANINGQTNYSTTICSGSSLPLAELSGAGTYLWNPGGQTTSSISVNPTGTTSYTVIATNASGCSDTAFAAVNVNSLPVVFVSADEDSLCVDSLFGGLYSATLTASGGVSYSWSPGGQTTSSILVSPSASTNYTVTGTDANGCSDTSSVLIYGIQIPHPSISASSYSVCAGQNVTLTASDAPEYLWFNSSTQSSIVITVNSDTVIYVNGNNPDAPAPQSCFNTVFDTIYVIAAPTPTVSASSYSVCSGTSTTLTASGGISYSWSTTQTINPIVVSPTSNTTYLVAVSNGSCTTLDSVAIVMNPSPAVTISVTTNNPCAGTLDTLIASVTGGTFPFTYLWNTSSTNDSIFVAPTVNTTYTVDIADANGCTATTNFSIGVVTPPTASISGTTTICSGQNTTLTASGGATYSWSNGSTASTISVSPTANTGYIVTVSNGSCSDTASVMVNVTTSPVAAIVSSDTTVCGGTTVTLSASGGNNYSWSTTETTSSIIVTPSDTTAYNVIVSNGSCSDTASITINVNTVTASVTGNTSLCIGDVTTLTAGGGGTYSWSTTETTSSIVINATATGSTNYTVTVTDASSCTDDTVVTVIVSPAVTPGVTAISSTVCSGTKDTLIASGGTTYLWSTGETNDTAVVVPINSGTSPITITYSVTAMNGSCSADTSISITVNPLPTIIASASPSTICAGDSSQLSASGGFAYSWSTGQTTLSAPIIVSPIISTTYWVGGMDLNGCVNFTSTNVTVSTISVNAGADVTICPGYTAQLNASVSGNTSFINYLWSPGTLMTDATVQNPSVNPDSTTAFAVEVTGDGCYAADTVVVVVDRDAVCDFCEKIYNGITPNGDGANDVWWIDGIQSFPKNTVSIFNRWGTIAWDASGYNNKDIIWKGTNQQGEPLPDGTYFYVIEVTSGDRTETCTGWVEVTH